MEHIGATILQQLGGAIRLRQLVGAHAFEDIPNGVRFRFLMNPSVDTVEITLNGEDLYDLKFFHSNDDPKEPPKSTYNDVYNDMLVDVFEEATGLYLTLWKRKE